MPREENAKDGATLVLEYPKCHKTHPRECYLRPPAAVIAVAKKAILYATARVDQLRQ